MNIIGADRFFRVIESFGGQTIYIPKADTLLRQARNREICKLYTGDNVKALSRQFRLSARQIRRIVAENAF